MNKNDKLLMLLIVVIALAVRLPGIFWGVKISHDPSFIGYHIDESNHAKVAMEFLTGITNEDENYLKFLRGFPFQVALCSFLLKPFIGLSLPVLILTGRLISLLYGIITVILIYFLAKELFQDPMTALASSVFLSLSGLHVTHSHYATVDVSNTFWIYATMFFSLLSIRRQIYIYFFVAVLSCGMALAFKLAWVCLIPILYVLIQQKKRLNYWLLTICCLFLFFVIANGGRYTHHNFILTLNNLIYDNIYVIKSHNKFLNPTIYLIASVPGLGLAIFLLLLYGGVRLHNIFRKDLFIIVILPVILHVISICFLDIPVARHILPAIPLLTVISGYGLMEIRKLRIFCKKKRTFSYIFLIIFIYQLIYIGSIEYYFVFDTRETATQWIREKLSPGTEVTVTRYVKIPLLEKDYKIAYDFESPFLILHETYYFRYLRSELNPFKKYPSWDEIFHGSCDDFVKIQRLFKGRLNYKLIKKFEVKSLTPEMYLYNKFLGTYPLFIGDTLIYKQIDA